jgi:outer membrane receptor for ferric coprogen and ferric-rhodotorulic acid
MVENRTFTKLFTGFKSVGMKHSILTVGGGINAATKIVESAVTIEPLGGCS